MRIAIFSETFLPKVDGISTTLCHYLEHLAKRGHQSIMFAPFGAPARYAETKITGLTSYPFPLYPDLKLVPPLVDVKETIEQFSPDLVQIVNPASLGWVGLRRARDLDVPCVASYHTDLPGYAASYGLPMLRDPLWSYFRFLHNQADLNLCPSTFTQRQLEKHGFERVKVWGRGVDTTEYSPAFRTRAWRQRFTGGDPDALVLVYVGRLASEKRVHWLRSVLDAIPGARLAIVGNGPLREELEELFAGTGTTFTGFLRGRDLARAYAAGDLFVFPSASETFGNVVLEAMASEMAVIAPRFGGPVDHVIDGLNGYLSDADDVNHFVDLARKVATDRSLCAQMGRNARAYAKSQSWDRILDQLLADLQQALDDYYADEREAWVLRRLKGTRIGMFCAQLSEDVSMGDREAC